MNRREMVFATVQRMYRYYRDDVLIAQVTEEDLHMCPDFWAKAAAETCDCRDVVWADASETSEVFMPEVDDFVPEPQFALSHS